VAVLAAPAHLVAKSLDLISQFADAALAGFVFAPFAEILTQLPDFVQRAVIAIAARRRLSRTARRT
jgi:hypothetical protein